MHESFMQHAYFYPVISIHFYSKVEFCENDWFLQIRSQMYIPLFGALPAKQKRYNNNKINTQINTLLCIVSRPIRCINAHMPTLILL